MVERILTKHPEEGKAGVNIDKEKYEMIRGAILELVRSKGEIAFKDLAPEVGKLLADKFEGSISWYVTTVKLDLEARGLIMRVPKASPQRIQLAE
jgi:hypothetical protein